ncbi:MobA/MobL family protein, partial [Yunchengibacter salinarum]|uniref:MobA/MobL family protein n=1 Tax=Yunchengibacter salinarum TaxID=3133399 RepID=UPI0035B663AE
MPQFEDFQRRAGRAAGRDQDRALKALATGRRGPRGRTFHMRIGSATKAASNNRGASPDYLARLNDFSKKDADLESVHGRGAAQMRQILNAVHDQTRTGRSRIAVTLTLELPADLSAPGRKRIAEAVIRDFEADGYPTMAVIHGNGRVQPHVHLVTPARRVWQAEG